MDSMKGKICLVTGGTSGVGKATALGLAELGATVVIFGRNGDRGETVLEECREISSNGDYHFIQADLSTKKGIRIAVSDFYSRFDRLHVLSNNMGILKLKRELTEDGIEKTFFIDYLAHFMITILLLDVLKAGSPSRILTVSGSPGMLGKTRINTHDLQFENNYNGFRTAIHAAFCKVVFTLELAKRLEGTGVTANTFHPGLIRTRMGRNFPIPLKIIAKLVTPFMKKHCPTSIYAASSPELEKVTGQFFAGSKAVPFAPKHYSEEAGRILWEESERLSGIHF